MTGQGTEGKWGASKGGDGSAGGAVLGVRARMAQQNPQRAPCGREYGHGPKCLSVLDYLYFVKRINNL